MNGRPTVAVPVRHRVRLGAPHTVQGVFMSLAIQTALLRAPSCGQTRSAPSPGGGRLGWSLAVLPRPDLHRWSDD